VTFGKDQPTNLGKRPLTMDEILARIVPTTFGCWEWQGCHQSAGYATVGMNCKQKLVHRVLYEHFFGPIPKPLEPDHLCRHRWCVNPLHIEPVTRRENIMRGSGPGLLAARNGTKTMCNRGHPFTPDNTYHWHGHRHCRECARLRKGRTTSANRTTV
jgi:hypothetical protein